MSQLTYDELMRELFPRLTGGIRWGLGRTQELLAAVGNPHTAFRSIHVGGTNGKGSVAATLASIFKAAGYKTGLYSSPHLCTFRERIQINGNAIGEAELVQAARRLWPHVQRHSPSFFEATTAIGFLALADAGVDVAVIEVGLGGRLDATNVITPDLSIITNISLDHAEYLGSTIGSVATEKAGIIKPGVPALTAEHDRIALDVFRSRASEAGALLHVMPRSEPADIACNLGGTTFTLRTFGAEAVELHTPLIGAHQASNAALAVHASALLPDDIRPGLAAIRRGVATVDWPGRMQVERIGKQLWVFDVAHNVAGVQSLVATLKRVALPEPLVVLVGILGDKDWKAMLPPLFQTASLLILTLPPTAPANRAWSPDRVLEEVASPRAQVHTDFLEAMQAAVECAGDGTILVTGSFHTVGDALSALDITPFGSDVTLPRL